MRREALLEKAKRAVGIAIGEGYNEDMEFIG
jgi:hypothetical protein